VPDLEQLYAERAARGIDFTSPPTMVHGQAIARFKDADGAECSVSRARHG
jgi:hypothetical protein